MDMAWMLPQALSGLGETAYSIWQQKKTWEREDTAYSRAIADMRKAGVSPVLFSGKAAATGAPFRAGSPVEKSMMMAQMAGAMAQVNKTKEETKSIALSNKLAGLTLQDHVRQTRFQSLMTEAQATANRMIRIIKNEGRIIISGNAYDADAVGRLYGTFMSSMDANMKKVAMNLTEDFRDWILSSEEWKDYAGKNPQILDAIAKAGTVEIIKKTNKHFLIALYGHLAKDVGGSIMRAIMAGKSTGGMPMDYNVPGGRTPWPK